MSDFWFQHLAATLSESGLIAYKWHVAEDRFEWAGDLFQAFGLQAADAPVTNAQFHKLLNPQYVPQRLSALHEALHRPAAAAPVSFASRYKIRSAGGGAIDVEESSILQYDPVTGIKTLCGFLKLKPAASSSLPLPSREATAAVTLHDGFVSHYGRRAMQHKIEEWAHSGNVDKNAAGYLLVVGIDRFLLLNEALGSRQADELIEKTGARLRQVAGDSATVMRIDGDVFGIFFEKAPYSEMATVARFILNNFSDAPLMTSRGPVAVSVSIGGHAVTPESCTDLESLLTKAEIAMQTAKERGRACFVSYSETGESGNNRQLLESGDEFLLAMKNDRIRLAFQPVMGAASEKVTFHECLIRMLDTEGKLVAAGDFLPAVEKLGLSRMVDHYAIRNAIQELSQFPDLVLSVNVSNTTLSNPDWLRSIVSSLRDRPSIADRLIIEITESAIIKDMNHAIRVARTIKDLGCRIALDDFGTGYTAFSQIKTMNVDIVKIDKSFVRNMNEGQNRLFVKALQSLADGVDVETVGEGAETMADARQLVTDGIDHIQGYVYGFPRVERVWLPKNHAFRQISLTGNPAEGLAAAAQETAANIAFLRQG